MELKDLEILEYSEDMGRVWWPGGFAQELEGKSIEEQLKCYGVIDWNVGPLSYYLLNWKDRRDLEPLDAYDGWEKIIVRDGKVVGFVRCGRRIFPYGVVATDSDSDNNGAGYKERTTYYILACVPGDRNREQVLTPPFGGPAPELKVPVIPYDGSHGEDLLPEELAKRLEGKPLSAQMYYFAIHNCNPDVKAGWVDDWEKYGSYYFTDLCMHRGKFLPFRDDVAGLIVRDDKIVGVRILLGEGEDAPTADLYPYEVQVCQYHYSWARHPRPERRQLIAIPLPG